MGMSVQLCEAEDNVIVEDLRGNVFGPLEFPRRDLMALNVQRGRDHGLPDYNSAREAYNLPRKDFSYFDEKYNNTNIPQELRRLYKNDSTNIDPWIGGILETEETGPGELFRAVIIDQFKRIRDGDRFWFENTNNRLFTNEEIARIKRISIYDIIMAVTKMDATDIPRNPFRVAMPTDTNLIEKCGLVTHTTKYGNFSAINASYDKIESCVRPKEHYDYFSNSETSYVLTFVAIGSFIVGKFVKLFVFRVFYNDVLQFLLRT